MGGHSYLRWENREFNVPAIYAPTREGRIIILLDVKNWTGFRVYPENGDKVKLIGFLPYK